MVSEEDFLLEAALQKVRSTKATLDFVLPVLVSGHVTLRDILEAEIFGFVERVVFGLGDLQLLG